MATLKNLTNSPYDIPLRGGGFVRLPAMGGTVSGDFEETMLHALRHSHSVEVMDEGGHDEHGPDIPTQAPLPLVATGSDNPPAPTVMTGPAIAVPPVAAVEPSPMVIALRGAATAIGIAYEPDWNEAKLQEEIGKWQEQHSS